MTKYKSRQPEHILIIQTGRRPSGQPGRTPGQDLVPVHSYPTACIQGRSYMGLWPAALHGSSGPKFHIDHNLLVFRDIEKERLSVH